MPHRAFFAFIFPSILAMVLFISLPIVSVAIQSLYIKHPQILLEVENSGPFGVTKETRVDSVAMQALQKAKPMGQFAGFTNFTDYNHLAFNDVGKILGDNSGLNDIRSRLMGLPFYRALAFTLAYCFLVTPLAMILGFTTALAINTLPSIVKGPAIFFSILPMIITPLVGSLILYWMFSPAGILGASLQSLFHDPTFSLRASPLLTWTVLIGYGIWTNGPFSFGSRVPFRAMASESARAAATVASRS